MVDALTCVFSSLFFPFHGLCSCLIGPMFMSFACLWIRGGDRGGQSLSSSDGASVDMLSEAGKSLGPCCGKGGV